MSEAKRGSDVLIPALVGTRGRYHLAVNTGYGSAVKVVSKQKHISYSKVKNSTTDKADVSTTCDFTLGKGEIDMSSCFFLSASTTT